MKTQSKWAPNASTINSTLSKLIEQTVQQMELQTDKTQMLIAALSHLTDIDTLYKQSDEELYEVTLAKLSSVPLLEFQASQLLQGLIEKYFKMLPLFRQSYQIAVLNSDELKYKRLKVDQPSIKLTIPIPYTCPPLSQARFLGDARCLTLEQQGMS